MAHRAKERNLFFIDSLKKLAHHFSNLNKGGRMAGKNWMKSAFKNSKGQFKAKAKKAGMSTSAFASKVLRNPGRYSEKTRRQANLARTAIRIAKRK